MSELFVVLILFHYVLGTFHRSLCLSQCYSVLLSLDLWLQWDESLFSVCVTHCNIRANVGEVLYQIKLHNISFLIPSQHPVHVK